MTRRLIAELLGTAILVYLGCGVATLMFGIGFGASGTIFATGVIVTAFAFGLVLMGLAYAFGPVSGSHVNPAVTLGVLVARRMSITDAVGYWIAQFAGGILGALALWGTFRGSPYFNRHVTGLGADGYGSCRTSTSTRRARSSRGHPHGGLRLRGPRGHLEGSATPSTRASRSASP